jgi:hypothetical protein
MGGTPGGGGGSGPGGGGGNGSSTGNNPDSPGGGNGANGGGSGVPNPGCGQATFGISTNHATPNVMMVVDESGSMTQQVPGTNMSKWVSLQQAVHSLLMAYDAQVNWGLSIFPNPGGQSCDPGKVDVPIGVGNTTQILSMIDGLTDQTIGGNTPTDQTLQAVRIGGGLINAAHNNYVLLMTDGLPNCGSDTNGVQSTIASLYAASPSIRTFVVGIGADTQSNPAALDGWATAGHTARASGTPLYYQANNVTDLQTAFADIISGIASCEYQLTQKPDDPSLLTAYLDGQAVANDPANGATYDAGSQSMIFHGTSCDKIKSGAVAKVDVVYGCPSPTIQ